MVKLKIKVIKLKKSENIEIKIDVNKKKVIEKEKFSRTEDWINTTFENLFYLDAV